MDATHDTARTAVAPPEERSVWTEVDGRQLHARTWRTGDRPDVVLVHGMVVSSRYEIPLAEQLAAHFDVWAPDQPGFGLSEGTDIEPRAARLAVHLLGWMDTVGIERADVVANSYGCQVAAELAMRHPDRVRRLVLASPTTDPTARSLPAVLGRFFLESRTQSKALQQTLLRDYRAAGIRRALATLRAVLRDRPEERLPHIHTPTLVVRGTEDPMVPPAWAQVVADLLPDGRLVTLDGATHAMVHDTPGPLADATTDFLQEDAR